MIDRKFTLGSIISIIVLMVNIVWSASILTNKTKTNADDVELALKIARSNEIKIAIIETKISQGFDKIETLIRELK
tara:strand:+ start:1444 stop:1671 length:228 start_codon:yes stop_codon:yes gene_type:complete